MLFVSETETAAIAGHAMAYDAVHQALIDVLDPHSATFPVVIAHGSDPADTFTIKSAATADLTGLKIGSFWPGNLDKGLPRHNSLILLFDQARGRIAAAIEAGKLNAYRTAAADAVAAAALARPDAATLAIFGAGHQAHYECGAIARIRPITRVLVVARRAGQAAEMVADLARQGLAAEVSDAQDACAAADIIVTATSARAPLFEAGWVRPGTHVASMGSDARGKQELPPELLRTARLFCDLPVQARMIGEFQHAPAEAEVVAIGDVLQGRHHGRGSAEEITVFDSSGLSIQDLRVAHSLLQHETLRERAAAAFA